MVILGLALAVAAPAGAETWPKLEDYAGDCTLIVKAKTVDEKGKLTFRVVETWRGTFDPKTFVQATPDGRFFASQGEHGVKVVDGQEIVFFFTAANQPDPKKIARHATAFPISAKGKLVYAATSDTGGKEYTVDDFKRAILKVPLRAPAVRLDQPGGAPMMKVLK
ncbi:MAG: hypothetical protein KF773_33865 [Deltaproteobacteria bacterium]|nr:hypothetical protein [Deltaproteobacteria bacterium]